MRVHAAAWVAMGILFASGAHAAKNSPNAASEAVRSAARARALIVGEGRAPFVLTASLSVRSSATAEWLAGSYELRWSDARNWREEIRLGDARAFVRLRDGKRRDRMDADPSLAGVHRIRRLMLSPAVRPILSPVHELGRIKSRDGATCFSERLRELEIGTCVDDATGALQRWQLGTEVYEFKEPAAFHDVAVARARRLVLDGAELVQARDVRVVDADTPESPAEAFVDGNAEASCIEADPPQFARYALPDDQLFRMFATDSTEPAIVTFVVGADGSVGDVTVKLSTGSDQGDRTAARRVKISLYAPATCDGRSVAQEFQIVQQRWKRP